MKMNISTNPGAFSPAQEPNKTTADSRVDSTAERVASVALSSFDQGGVQSTTDNLLAGRVQDAPIAQSDPATMLLEHASNGDASAVTQLLESHFPFSREDFEHAFLCAHQGTYFYESDEVFNYDDYYYAHLYWGQRGDTEVAKIIIEKAQKNLPPEEWPSLALNWAAEHGFSEIVEKFLTKSELQPESVISPICSAALGRQGEMVKLLKEHLEKLSPELCPRLISNLNKIPSIAFEAARLKREDGMAKFLLENGFEIKPHTFDHHLCWASEEGLVGDVEIMVKTGLKKNAISDSFYSRLVTYATESRQTEVVKILLQNAQNPKESWGQALVLASKNGDDGLVKTLLQNGQKNEESCRQALALASQRGHVGVIAEFIPANSLRVNDVFLSAVLTSATKQKQVIQTTLKNAAKVLTFREHLVHRLARAACFTPGAPHPLFWIKKGIPVILERIFRSKQKEWKDLREIEDKK
jgi:hypothetical protein